MNKKNKIVIGLLIAIFAISGASIANAFSIGSRGGEVADYQAMLIEAGYDIPALTTGGASFGYYGVQTDRASKQYQASRVVKSPILGGVSSPDIPSPYFSFGDVRQWAAKTNSLTQATTTICALQSPVSTSTMKFGSIRLSVGSTTASLITLAKATTAFATTTAIATSTLAANAQITLTNGSTTPERTAAFNEANLIFSPSTWFVVGMQDATPDALPSSFSPTGTCEAIWIEN